MAIIKKFKSTTLKEYIKTPAKYESLKSVLMAVHLVVSLVNHLILSTVSLIFSKQYSKVLIIALKVHLNRNKINNETSNNKYKIH